MTTNLTSVSTFGWYSDTVISDQLFNITPFGWYAEGIIIPPEVCDSWQNSLITALRILINDQDGVMYQDDKLEDILALAASMVTSEVPLDVDYDVDINPPNISPDPIINGDQSFVNLVTLKAACLLDKSSLGYNSLLSGVSARCGNARMRTLMRMDGLGSSIDNGYCLSYENAKRQYMSGVRSTKQSVLSPFVNKEFDATYQSRR